MLATGNNCYFYSSLRRIGFEVLRVEQVVVSEEVAEAVGNAAAASKVDEQNFLEELREELLSSDVCTPINALYLLCKEQGNRHAQARLRRLAGDLIEEDDATTLAWLAIHRRRLSRPARDLIMRTVMLRYLGVEERREFLGLSKSEWRRQLKRLTFYFENETFGVRGNRKKMHAEHKEEIRIKRRMAELVNQRAGEEISPQQLQQLVSVMNYRKLDGQVVDVMALSPAQVINIVLEVTDSVAVGHGRSRSVILGRKWSAGHPPSGVLACRDMLLNPLRILAFTG